MDKETKDLNGEFYDDKDVDKNTIECIHKLIERENIEIKEAYKELSRKEFRKLKKKLKRKIKRQQLAEQRILNENKEPTLTEIEALLQEEKIREEQRKKWELREKEIELEIQKKKELEKESQNQKDEFNNNLLEENKEINKNTKEMKSIEEMVKLKYEEINQEIEKHRVEENFKYITLNMVSENNEDSNLNTPQASLDLFEIMGNKDNNELQICQFYKRTGACRFGNQCDRIHVQPTYSKTIIVRNMFDLGNEIMSAYLFDENELIEYDEDSKDHYLKYKEFYDDVYPEFSKYGKIEHFYVCNNIIPHLRGNVYIDYSTEEEAFTAFCEINGRWYGGKQLRLEFISISDWKMALCGHNERHEDNNKLPGCPKLAYCNFLHVFRNKDNKTENNEILIYKKNEYTQTNLTSSTSNKIINNNNNVKENNAAIENLPLETADKSNRNTNDNNNNENNNNNNNENGSKHLIESSKNDSNNGENHNSTKNLNNNNNPINENSQHESETSIHSENATEMNIKNEIENKADSKNIVSRKKSNFKSGRLSPPPDGKKFKRFESNPYKISNRHIYNLTFFNELQVKIFDFLHDISKHLIKYNKDFALIQKYKHYVVNKEWAAVKISEFNLVILMKLLQYPSIVIDNPEIITLIKWICIKNIQNYFEKIMKKNSDGLNEQALVEDKTFFNYINMGNKTRCIVNLIKYSRSSNRTKRNPEQYYYLTSIKYTNTIIVREYRIFISILANALNYATSHKKTEVKSILEKDRNLVEALKFYNLVSDNSFDNVKNSFKKVTYFDIMNTEGQNPVSLAIKRGYTPIAKYLIDTGEYDINDKDKNGSTSLILAVLQENTELINKLLDHPDVKVNLKDKNGNSAFFYAVKSYNKDYIEKFMNHPGVNINTKNNNKLTPCILTVSFVDKYFNISKYFLTNEKVDINAYDRYGNCALIIAMIKGKIKIVDLLLEQERLLVNNKNKNGKTVLRQIIEDNNSFFTKKLLTRHDIDINVPGPDGRPVIFTAIQYKGYDILKLLLHQKDVDINYQDPDGFSPLMVAVQCQNMNIINTLLKLKDLKINLKNSRGRTALRIAVDIRNYKIIKKLLQIKDIDLDIPDISGVKIVDVINQDNYQNANIKKLLFSKIKS